MTMRANIVFAHPGQESFNHEILAQVQKSCDKAGIKYVIRDLYQMKFSPVLSNEDLTSIEAGQIPAMIEEEQSITADADLLVMIYPIWWWSQPAILKGWIDRVFLDKFAFEYTSNGPVGLFKNKQAVVFTTTRESEAEMKEKGYDQVIKTQIVDGVLEFSGFENVVFRNFAEVPYVSDEQRMDYLDQVDQIITSVRQPANAGK
ncbi:NAD(P)H-dependent oxidoreductase [Brevibacillus dissolubilis]|uniref:NAD(P)H-dependent oxidoreductase n=1 Tax=Brevibacillus dissolubilis TaxID=1844116 RepID=UPI0021000E7B|nr:NAD(P)H-dependent oxidoreductase [Brevibacillus dissolubilis]